MLPAAFFSLVALVLVPSLAVQVPLGSSHCSQDGNRAEWNLDKLPNPNSTDHLVFETVHSLLQHWPNTRMRNGKQSVRIGLSGFQLNIHSSPGHNIVPGVIPKGTLLYHGTNVNEFPLGPEWVATDPEHAHIYCVDRINQTFQQTCLFLTLATTRPLKVIYFDGNSAANMPTGTFDTQELIVWGRVNAGNAKDEPQLVQDLCRWGENFGVDGFVRYIFTSSNVFLR